MPLSPFVSHSFLSLTQLLNVVDAWRVSDSAGKLKRGKTVLLMGWIVMWERGKFYFELGWWQILCILSVFVAACIDILGDSWQDWQLWEPSFAAALQESGGLGAGYGGARTSWGSYKWELLVGAKGGGVEGSWLCSVRDVLLQNQKPFKKIFQLCALLSWRILDVSILKYWNLSF